MSLLSHEAQKELLAYYVARFVPALGAIVAVALFVRGAGTEEYGRAAMLLASAQAATMFGGGWLSQGVLRFLPGEARAERSSEQAVVIGSGASAVLSGLLGGLVAAFLLFPTVTLTELTAAASLAALLVFYTVTLSKLRALNLAGIYAAGEILRIVVLVAAAFLFLNSLHLSAAGIVWLTAIAYGSATFFVSRRSRRVAGEPIRRPHRPGHLRAWLGRLLRYGFPVALWMGLVVSIPLIDRGLLIRQHGELQTGIFSALYDVFFRSASLLFAPVVIVLHTKMMRAANSGHRDVAHRMVTGTLFGAIALLPILGLSAALLSKPVSEWIGIEGGATVSGWLPALMAAGGAVWQLALIAHKGLEIAYRTDLMLYCLLASIGLHAVSAWWMGQVYGPSGIAFASVLSGSLYCAVTLLIARALAGSGRA